MGVQSGSRTGTTFGPYRLDSLLGRGGMGEVYRAHDTLRDRDVAVKMMSAEVSADAGFAERFGRECQLLARLGEPHIIPIHNFGEIDSQLYLEMRLVEGRDLRDIIREGPLEPRRAVSLIEQVGAALDAVHQVGIVHRDVKPENVLVTSADFAYLIDFGIAVSENDTQLTRTGDLVGSIAYVAPERFGDSPATPAADVYSLAVVLFELLTGSQPYRGGSVSAIMKNVLFDPVPSARSINPGISPALDDVLQWGLAREPGDRCPSTLAFARASRDALERLTSDRTAVTHEVPKPYSPRSAAGAGEVQTPTMVAHPVTAIRDVPPGSTAPDAPYGSAAHPAPVPTGGRRGASPLLVMLGILLVVLVGAGAWLLSAAFRADGDEQANAAVNPAVTGMTGANETAPESATATQTSLPPGARPCPGIPGLATHEGRKTSCEFAVSVRDAYRSSGPQDGSRKVNGWAPQQQALVPMFCGPESGIVICRGGTQSIVYLY